MLSITDLKKGTVFVYDDKPYKVLEYSQKVIGRGGSIVNVKIKNLVDDKVLEKTFKGNDRLEPAQINNVSAEFLYSDNKYTHFMSLSDYEQYQVQSELFGEQINYLKEGQRVNLQFFNNQIIDIILPKNLFLKVSEAENAVKGDTSGAITKFATLETGVKVRVPSFIKKGDEISVDVETGSYRERKK